MSEPHRQDVHAHGGPHPSEQPPVTRDRGDDHLVALALGEGVDAIISGDRDLIDVGLSTPVVWTPRQLADRMGAG